MKLIIDGYNLLKHIVGADYVEEKRRTHFIGQLAEYAHKKKLPILVVFDGGPSVYPTRDRHNGVEVIYSGTKESADDYIKQYVEGVQPNNYLLISSDKELVNFVQYHTIDALDSQTFHEFMQEALVEHAVEPLVKRVKGEAKKLHPEETNNELDVLMHQAAEIIVRKTDDRVDDQLTQAKKIAKKDRIRAQKLNKL